MGSVLIRICASLIALMLSCMAAFAADENKLDVRLLPKTAVKTSDGCAFALWQRNRDPHKDKYAYAFYVGFHDAHPLPDYIHALSRPSTGVTPVALKTVETLKVRNVVRR